MAASVLSLCLLFLGIAGTATLLSLTGVVFWRSREYRVGSFRWHMRNLYLKHLAALACLFFLAMTASYAVLLEAWAVFYFILACKTATWWMRLHLAQRT